MTTRELEMEQTQALVEDEPQGSRKPTSFLNKRYVLVTVVLLCVIVVIIVGVLLSSGGVSVFSDPNGELSSLMESQWKSYLYNHPEESTLLGFPGQNDRWSDLTIRGIGLRKQISQNFYDKLTNIDRDSLSDDYKMDYDLLKIHLENAIQFFEYKTYLMPIDQLQGIQVMFPRLIANTPFDPSEPKTYEDYLSRLGNFTIYINQVIELISEGINQQITVPQVLLEIVLEEIFQLFSYPNGTKLSPENTIFFQPFLKLPSNSSFRVRGEQLIDTDIINSFQVLYNFIKEKYMPFARKTISVLDLVNGDAYYKFLVQYETSLQDDITSILNIGESEVNRIFSLINATANFQGYPSAKDYYEFLRQKSSNTFTTEVSLLSFVRDIGKRADPMLPFLFGRLPKCPYGMEAMPFYEEAFFPFYAYYLPPLEGCMRAGYVAINTREPKTCMSFLYDSLILAESVPGHHLQLSLQQESYSLPNFRKHGKWNAFFEGWGLYAELLGLEMGFYENEETMFGALLNELICACRLVVDIGIHVHQWDRSYAIGYLQNYTFMDDMIASGEVDRCIAQPAHALTYKIGQLAISNLRNSIEMLQGNNFNVKSFHDSLLSYGSLPLNLMKETIQRDLGIR